MMNIDNLERLESHLRNSVRDSDFRMHTFCGTACCIGGHAHALAIDEGFDNDGFENIQTVARHWLDLSAAQAHSLFFPHCTLDSNGLVLDPPGDDQSGWDATPQQAADAVRMLIDTGIVRWSEVMSS